MYTGWPPKKGNSRYTRFYRTLLCSTVIFFTLLDRASFPYYNNTKIIKFGWELFILWVISFMDSFSGFARFPEFRGTINDSFSSTCANTYQHSTSYKEISVPMTCLDCKYLLGNTRIPHTVYSQYTDPPWGPRGRAPKGQNHANFKHLLLQIQKENSQVM